MEKQIINMPLEITGNNKSLETQSQSPAHGINETVNQLWEMYQSQLHRNVELMKTIDRQQHLIQSLIANQTTPVPPPAELPPAAEEPLKEATPELPPPAYADLSMEQANSYTKYFKAMYSHKVRRLDAIHSILKLLHTLYHLGGSAYPDVLFEKAGLIVSTGNRHIAFLHNQGLVSGKGTSKHDHKYHLTANGRLFLQGKLVIKSIHNSGNDILPPPSLI